MRVMVTGGAGYIGSVVGAMLLDAGHQVTALDDLSTGHEDAVAPGAEFVKASITEVGAVLADQPYDAVMHLAAKSLVAESVEHPDRYWHNNVGGTLALLDAMRTHGVPRLVFSSTAATYGEPSAVPIPEDASPAPTSPYGTSKLAVDLALADYTRAYGLASASLRYFNVAGALLLRPDAAYGERHAIETHLIPIALQVAAGTRDVLDIYGTDYPTPDGTCIRDYLHVADVGDAHLRAMSAMQPGTHRVFNLGSGTGYSVREVVAAVRRATGREVPVHSAPRRPGDPAVRVAAVRRATGREIPVRSAPRRPGDPAVLVASNARAEAELGWTPARDLDEMVADAWAFVAR